MEHPFRVIKRQFGFVKVKYRGLAKNTANLVTLFALSNLWLVSGGARTWETTPEKWHSEAIELGEIIPGVV